MVIQPLCDKCRSGRMGSNSLIQSDHDDMYIKPSIVCQSSIDIAMGGVIGCEALFWLTCEKQGDETVHFMW